MDGEQISIQPEIWLDNEDEKVLKNNANEVWVVGEVELAHRREFQHLAQSKGHSAPLNGNADLPLPRTATPHANTQTDRDWLWFGNDPSKIVSSWMSLGAFYLQLREYLEP